MKQLKEKRVLYIAVNVFLVLLLIAYIAFFTVKTRTTSSDKELSQFVASADIIQQEATRYIDSVCKISLDWTSLVNKRKWSPEEVAENIGDLNSDPNVIVHIINAETKEGVSSVASQSDPENFNVQYSGYYSLCSDLDFFLMSAKKDDIYVTGSFTNCTNFKQSIAFVSVVDTYRNGTAEKSFLMRIEPLEAISRYWVFNTEYENAQVSMITSKGDYIVRSPMLKNENFYEFLRSFNDITYPKIRQIRMNIDSSEHAGGFILKNSQGADTIYAYSKGGYNNWVIIASLEKSELKKEKIQWSLLFTTSFIFLLLIIINLSYFIALNRRLKTSFEEVREANSAKTRFLSSMSHDIRTPMNAIVGLTTIAQHNINDKAHVQECLRKITMAGNLLLTLINDILDISQVESGKFVLRPSEFSLAEAIENIVNIIYPQAEEHELQFNLNAYDITEEYLYADKLRLNQIFINILSNAVKYTPSGGRVDASVREEKIDGEDSRIRLIFTVSDTGIGMSEEYQKTIFEPFTRENDSRIDTIQGSGFGMTVTKYMVDLMHGSIDIKSRQNVGSTFTVTLELDCSRPGQEIKKFPGMRTLLVCENERAQCTKNIWNELQVNEDSCLMQEAAEVFKKSVDENRPYRLVIIGRNMSGSECLEVSQTIRSYAPKSVTKIIVAAYDFSDIEKEMNDAGIDAFVYKPIFAGTLSGAIERITKDEEDRQNCIGAEDRQFSGVHLLVAEDNDLNWEIFESLLGFIGVKADRVKNGSECVQKLETSKDGEYTAVFMDIQMPVMNGYEAARKIRAFKNEQKAAIPIIAMTADAFANDIEACKKAGMNGHIAKPIDPKILAEEIKNIVDREARI